MSVICQLYIYDIIYPLLASYITHLAILVKVLHFTSYLRVTNYVGLLYITYITIQVKYKKIDSFGWIF